MLSLADDDAPPAREDLLLSLMVVGPILAARGLMAAPWWAVGVAAILAAIAMRPIGLVIVLLLVVGVRANSVLASLQPLPTQPIERVELYLIDDPRPSTYGARAVARLGSAHVVVAFPFGGRGASLSAGDRLVVSGTQRGRRPETSWAISRGVVGQITVSTIDHVDPAQGLNRAANDLRSLIEGGAESLSSTRRVLFTGLVFGDDRGQDIVVADNFRASGLGHLLAVSGQNVVFVLALAAPLVSRLRRPSARVVVSIGLLTGFGVMTRFEPSVTRAIAMAAIVLVAAAAGRPATARIVLAPAVLGLLLLDPKLAWSLAFQLSVAATLGLVVLAPRLTPLLRGPEPFRLALAATVSAQLAVAPLIYATFGPISLVAIPANVLAAPIAGLAMMWGLVAGPIAGTGPPVLGELLHIPTRIMLWWIDGVARIGSEVDIGQFTAWHLGTALLAAWLLRHTPRPSSRRMLLGVIAVSLSTVLLVPRPLEPGRHQLVKGLEVVRSEAGHDIVILDSPTDESGVIAALRQSRLGRIDLLITRSGGRRSGRLVATIGKRFEIIDIWAPSGHQVLGARVVDPISGSVGRLHIEEDGDRITITAETEPGSNQ